MNDLLSRYLRNFHRAPDDGGSGGGGDGATGGTPSGTGGGGAGGDGSPAGASGGGDGGQQPGSANAGEWNPQWPEGFPENLRGKDATETLTRVNAALRGYRERDAARDLPQDPKGYLSLEGLKDFQLSDQVKPYFEELQKDPMFEPLAAHARELELTRPQFLSMWKKGMEVMAEAGLLEPPVDPKAERAALLPEEAKTLPQAEQDKAIDKRMQDNLAFIDLMVQNRGLPKEAGEYAQLMLADRAHGHRFLEWMRGQIQGGAGSGPGAHGSGGGTGDTRESLKAELAKPEMQPGHPNFDRKKYAELEGRYKALIGPGGN